MIIPVIYILWVTFHVKQNIENSVKPTVLEPTLNDPFMNNIDSDVLKVLPKDTKEIKDKENLYFHWNYYKDEDNVYDKQYDGLAFYTTPPDDQEAFIKFLQYDLQVPLDIEFNDLKKEHYRFPSRV